MGIASAVYAHLAGSSRVILVGGPPGRPRLARETRAGADHGDIFEWRGADERMLLVQNAATGRCGTDGVSACADAPKAVTKGWQMARRGRTFLALGQYTDRGEASLTPHVVTRKQRPIVGS